MASQNSLYIHWFSAVSIFTQKLYFLSSFIFSIKCMWNNYFHLVLHPLHCAAWLKSPINHSCMELMSLSLLYLYTISIALWYEFSYSVKNPIQSISYPNLFFLNILCTASCHGRYWCLSQLYVQLCYFQVLLSLPCES